MTTLADRYFDLHIRATSARNHLEDEIIKAADMDPWDVTTWVFDDITMDYYDTSFELKHVEDGWKPTRTIRKKWRNLGFSRCWICYKDGTEKYYTLV